MPIPSFFRSIVLHSLFVCLMIALLMLAIACNPAPTTGNTHPLPTPAASPSLSAATTPEDVVQTLKLVLADELGITDSEISLQASKEVEWSDACLGAPQTDELCAQVITPGYQVTFTTPQGTYSVHSDRTGQVFRTVRSP